MILCSTAFCRLSNDSQRRITQRIDVDGAAYRLHGQKLAGIAFNRECNNVGETASAAAAGNRFHSGIVRVSVENLVTAFLIFFRTQILFLSQMQY